MFTNCSQILYIFFSVFTILSSDFFFLEGGGGQSVCLQRARGAHSYETSIAYCYVATSLKFTDLIYSIFWDFWSWLSQNT